MAANHIYLPFLIEENHYSYLYRELISQAQFRNWSRKSAPCYVEEHHVWPESLGGPDYSQNLVYLTASEHYYVHYYLMKMLEDQNDENYKKMVYACWQMNICGKPGIDLEHEAAIYEEARIEFSKSMSGENNPKPMLGKNHSEDAKQQISESLSGENHPMYGKNHSENTKQKQSDARSGENHPKPMLGTTHSEDTKQQMSEAKLGKTHSEDAKQQISDAQSGENNPRARPISIDGIEFLTTKDAAEYFNKNTNTIRNWLKLSKHPDCFYLDENKEQ